MRVTVFTPTFNRGYIIENLYRSLQRQTYKNFEWLVIDDGSTDDTEKLFVKWQKEDNFFNIRYYKVTNGGKHRAVNRATDIANGELFFIVDSDDILIDYALEYIDKWEKEIQNNDEFCGIAGNRGKNFREEWGTTFEGKYIDCTSLERSKYNITGDKAEVFYTKILKRYKFPEFEKENFITESVVWNKMANDGYKIRCFNKVIYLSDYLEDGLSNSGEKLFANNPCGTAYYIKQNIVYYKYNLLQKMSQYNAYYIMVKNNISFSDTIAYLGISRTTMIISIVLCSIRKSISLRKVR